MESNQTYKVGWVGTGQMGKSMALHLYKLPNLELFVYNRTKSKTDDLVAKGATWCDSPQKVAS